MVVQLLDEQRNMYGGSGTRLPKITYDCPKLHVNPVAGQSACWESPAATHGVHALRLPQLVVTPKTAADGLKFERPDLRVKCKITVGFSNLMGHQSPTVQVSISFVVNVVPGNKLNVQLHCTGISGCYLCLPPVFAFCLIVHSLTLVWVQAYIAKWLDRYCTRTPGHYSS